MTGADDMDDGMDRVVCGACGARSEVQAGTRPPCEVCGVSLRLGTLAPPVEETEAEPPAPGPGDDRRASGGGAELEGAAEPGAPPSGATRERCRCDRGGPRPDDPTVCFRCGGRLPMSGVPHDAASAGRQPAGMRQRAAGDIPDASDIPDISAPRCTLVLAGGHRVRVGSGILISGESSYWTRPRVLFIDSRTVSRKHAWLREDTGKAGQVEIVDLGSTNGTWIEGRRIEAFQAVEIGPEARVRISFGRSVHAALEFGPSGEVRG